MLGKGGACNGKYFSHIAAVTAFIEIICQVFKDKDSGWIGQCFPVSCYLLLVISYRFSFLFHSKFISGFPETNLNDFIIQCKIQVNISLDPLFFLTGKSLFNFLFMKRYTVINWVQAICFTNVPMCIFKIILFIFSPSFYI
jgi:hypothetical protein